MKTLCEEIPNYPVLPYLLSSDVIRSEVTAVYYVISCQYGHAKLVVPFASLSAQDENKLSCKPF
jgi:hypothetical protein